MNGAEYLAFVEATCDAWDGESAARIIEEKCRPGDRTVTVTDSAQAATGPQNGAA